ncbi:MAG: tRNA (adenosine(37)-N6)-dimethylallyltransferase MiaA [Candidatus Zambryskibacteria bacterium]|nr:tRNA (adenosine(37)-N6)-dimethylallyltransferase MiaA [Candidatus Zambryskibacteria bacterium]
MKKVLVVVGPTASGKSDLAVRLAKKLNGEIISADSRQVYKGLNIGTGKITKKEMRGVPHHMLDLINPKKQFSASEFTSKANEAIKLIEAKKALPIVVGGTGFYIDALTGRTSFPDVGPNKLLRRKLNKLDNRRLFEMLRKKDPKRAKTIDANNKVRLIRALEIIDKYGSVPQLGSSTSKYKFIYIGLRPNDLKERIIKRVKQMFKKGLLREISKLKRSGVSEKRLMELGFEYWHPTEESLFRDTVRYAKRQMTWFKRNKNIRWFDPSQYKDIENYAKRNG